MKAIPLTVHWHEHNQPIYSAHFEPHGKGRLATAGGDNNVRLWKVEGSENPKIVYLSTLSKHNQAVNVVRFCPRGEMLASAGDDGTVILWVPSEGGTKPATAFGEDELEDKETWRLKHMCRSMGSEIYDLAWSPDGVFFITGSMDNIARVWNASTGQCVRQIAEHNHYVQGVAWDPLNEYIATQSSDRSVHIYTLKTKDGQFTLAQHGKISKMDLPPRRVSSGSPAPPDLPVRTGLLGDSSAVMASPAPSTPGTPTSFSLPMNPPMLAPSRRSSFGSSRRSTSPSPALPLPAVKSMDFSPRVNGLGVKNTNIYFNETLTSFFRRLTFTPDGSLLLTPAGQYKTSLPASTEGGKTTDEIINTVYIYTRAGLNKPPIAHLPGHKKPSVAVKCSPVLYNPRSTNATTKHITVDTSSCDDAISSLPPPAISTEMEPPPTNRSHPQLSPYGTNNPVIEPSVPEIPPNAAFALPYRMVYAVATQDAVLIYDTHQQTPLCIVSNLHYAAFTDLTWSSDGLTLLMTSTDGFCSVVAFEPEELGQVYTGPAPLPGTPTLSTSSMSNPTCIPNASLGPTSNTPRSPIPMRSHPPLTRTPSGSSVNTLSTLSQGAISLTPTVAPVPSITASSSSSSIPLNTPPQTPHCGTVLGKRDGEVGSASATGTQQTTEGRDKKRRRIAPTPVTPGVQQKRD